MTKVMQSSCGQTLIDCIEFKATLSKVKHLSDLGAPR